MSGVHHSSRRCGYRAEHRLRRQQQTVPLSPFAKLGVLRIERGRLDRYMLAKLIIPSGNKLASHVIVVLGIAGIAIAMRLYGLSRLFDYDGYDEGVYWQTLRAMHAGYSLYDQIFYAQPPLFASSIYPFYALFGQSIAAARTGIAALSLLGLLGVYMIGKALASRAGGLAATSLLLFTPVYLRQSQILEAEGPATAVLFLCIGTALLWWESPQGKKGGVLAVICGATLSIGILMKLLNVTAVVPILMLILWRMWNVRLENQGANVLMPIVLGFIAAVAVAFIALMPFLHSLGPLLDQVVSYHLVAKKAWQTDNFEVLGRFFSTNAFLSVAALLAAILALIRRDWRVIPLLAWLMATIVLLAMQVPLFPRHVIVLVPPLIAISVSGLGDLPALRQLREILRARTPPAQLGGLLMGVLVFVAVLAGIVGSYGHYQRMSAQESNSARSAAVAADLRQVTGVDQWVITDGQFIAAMADRDTPPSLVDTSHVRIFAGYLATQELIEAASDVRVHVVLFATNRFALGATANFHGWVAQHFALVRKYGPGLELWIR
jgi:4-amino-4-deoxy-L-arabinose transferase-like glycosyltransferase